MSLDSLLTQTLVIERGTEGRTATGQSAPAYADVATVKGLIQFAGGRELPGPAQGLTDIISHRAFLARKTTGGAAYTPGQRDRIRDAVGQRFEIIAVGDAGGRGHHFEADLKVVAL